MTIPRSVTTASGPVSVNALASTPYNVAVGGTQFNENGNSAYWGAGNDGHFSSANSYIPEVAWNESCTAAECGSNAGIWAGSGGASILFGKPAWQSAVAGIPDDGARDVPDVSFSSAGHDFYLLCLDGSCTTKLGQSSFSGVSGTSAATPSFAAIMALVVQHTGSRQGQAAQTLYRLAGDQSLASCNAGAPAGGCIFNDITVGNNAVPGETGYGTSTASYQSGVGYDLATGLGSVNAYNLITGWNGGSTTGSQLLVGIESPSPQNSTLLGITTFSGWALSDASSITSVKIAVDSIPYGTASYGASRSDICAQYSGKNCPHVGWSFPFNTTLLAAGAHIVDATVTASSGDVYTASSSFTVANWTANNPMRVDIDTPSGTSEPFSGTAYFGGWAIDDVSAISQVEFSIDGVSQGLAIYGGVRSDVCSIFQGKAGCPNVGWNVVLDTTKLSEGTHTLAINALSVGGQHSTAASTFDVLNSPSDSLVLNIDSPSAQNGAFTGHANFGGWAVSHSSEIASIAMSIDGFAFGSAVYGGNRQDVCNEYPGSLDCPNVGWNFAVDTTQLLNGVHLLKTTLSTRSGQKTTATRSFTVSNAVAANLALIYIDSPSSENSVVIGQTVFSGWATHASSSQIDVAIDGAPHGVASYGISRPDVCAIFPGDANCPRVGWNLSVDTTQLADGPHTLTITEHVSSASSSSGKKTLSAPFTVANWTTANPMVLTIDTPSSQGGALSGTAAVGGWVIDMLAPIRSVTVSVDGLAFGNAIYGGVRSDVCRVYPSVFSCPNVGWNFYLDTTLLSDGAHELSITGTTTAGQSSTAETTFQIDNGPSTPLRISIDTPSNGQTLADTAAIGGWALARSGAQITNVEVLVDGVVTGSAMYGGSRADVCATFTTAGGCPNVGWNYLLDTSGFANGSHRLDVRAVAADGLQYTNSQSFNIANQP